MNTNNIANELKNLSPQKQFRRFAELVNPEGPLCFRLLSPKSAVQRGKPRSRSFSPKQRSVLEEAVYEALNSLNERGRSVYMTINKVDGSFVRENRWKAVPTAHITGVNALFLDFDTPEAVSLAEIEAMEVPPSVVVETSIGKFHCYWLLKSSDEIATGEFKQVQNALQRKFKALKPDVVVNDLPRIMRVPGFIHSPELNNNEGKFVSRLVWANDLRFTRQEMLDFIGDAINEPDTPVTADLSEPTDDDFDAALKYEGEKGEKLLGVIESAARFLIEEAGYCATNDTFQEMAAVFSHFQGTSNEAESEGMFEELCASAPGYTGSDELERMKSFAYGYSGRKVTEGSLFKRATDEGWINPAKVYSSGFYIKDDGVYRLARENDETDKKLTKISSTCIIKAWTECRQNGKGGFVLNFRTLRGKLITKVYDRSLLHEPRDLVKRLEDDGLFITPGERGEVAKYLGGFRTDKTAYTTSQTGWCGESFVLPNKTLKPDAVSEEVIFSSNEEPVPVSTSGTLTEWKETVGTACSGNPVLTFSASVAFAAPMLDLMGHDGGGFHLYGSSSKGKSTALQVAASVYGKPDGGVTIPGGAYLQTWRQTDNSVENSLARYNSLMLPLDDMRQVRNAQALIDTILMIGNNQGKGRANKNGDAQSKRTFRTLVLSTGEKTTQAMIEAEGKPFDAGTEVRLPNIDIVFENGVVHDAGLFDGDTKALIEHVKSSTSRFYGVVGLEWLNVLVAHRQEITQKAAAIISRFRDRITESYGVLGSQQQRVIERFALCAAAGTLATEHGLTGWAEDEGFEAAVFMAERYFEERGTKEDTETQRIMRRLYSGLTGNNKRFPFPYSAELLPAAYMSQENVHEQLGYRLPKNEKEFLAHLNSTECDDPWDGEPDIEQLRDLSVLYLVKDQKGLASLVGVEHSPSQVIKALKASGCLVEQYETRGGKTRSVNKKKFASTSAKNFGAKQRSFYVIDLSKLDDAEF